MIMTAITAMAAEVTKTRITSLRFRPDLDVSSWVGTVRARLEAASAGAAPGRPTYAPHVRKLALVALAAVAALAVVGVTLSLLPFDRPHPRGTITYGPGFSSRCSPPIVSAWRPDHESGWFGYAPITGAPPISFGSCQGAARHRLAWAGAVFGGAALLGLGLRRRKRDVEDGVPPAST
jgi:hypothetical protein